MQLQSVGDQTREDLTDQTGGIAESAVIAAYIARRDAYAAERDELTRRWNKVANFRLAAFALVVLAVGWGWWERIWWPVGLAALPLIAFVALVVVHQRLGRQRQRAIILHQVNEEGLRRLARDWATLPEPPSFQPDPRHPYAADLDLFGHASLIQLLDITVTPMGQTALRQWLLAPAPPRMIQSRQDAARELAPAVDTREALALAGRLTERKQEDPGPFLEWAAGEPWLRQRRGLVWLGLASVVIFWVLVVANIAGIIGLPLWLVPLIVNIVINQVTGKEVRERVAAPAERHEAFRTYAGLLEIINTAHWSAPLLTSLQARIVAGGTPAYLLLRRLNRLTRFWVPADALFHWPLQAVSLWDLFLLDRLEDWQATAGSQARDWMAVIGDVEALTALGTLAHDHPAWAFPTIDPAADRFDARALGHPLLPDDVRVVNDVTVGPPGTFLLVTGSNMSGKSTLLRAIGINTVLAGTGGPVCAEALQLPPVVLWTSVRVQDSLERGVSFFMAELQRLKQIVDAARSMTPDAPRLLYLLDEILQGTNTAERQIAARRIIRYLVDQGALGAVSTHDLTLAEGPELSAVAIPVHLQDTLSEDGTGPAMWFDYKLRPGLATSTNALRLMDLVGFDLEG
ncbi:MAG TPA: hypothetical protein VFL82_13640 [Thermomicrobiales bacterium]|nr:hypothetical protein [Thermomicrobiales bacterium]